MIDQESQTPDDVKAMIRKAAQAVAESVTTYSSNPALIDAAAAFFSSTAVIYALGIPVGYVPGK